MARNDNDTRPDINKAGSSLGLSGKYVLILRRDGKVIDFRRGKNLITSAGEALAARMLDPAGVSAAPNYIAFGSGNATALKADTQLQTEIAGTRTLYSSSTVTTNQLELAFQHTAAGSFSLYEMGIFNASTVGTMMSRFLTQKLSMALNDVIDITWTLTFSGVD